MLIKSVVVTFLFAFVLPNTCLQAQENTDSLWRVWNTARLPDTIRLSALHTLSFRYAKNDPDSARVLAEMQLAFSRQKNLPGWQARALNIIAISYRLQSDYAKAIQHYEESIRLLEKTGDRNYMAAVFGNMADVYRIQSNFPKAIEYVTQALKLAEETGDERKAADAYISIATLYYETPGQETKTLEYLEKARAIYEKRGSKAGMTLVYGNLSAVYLDRDEFDKALEFNKKTMQLQLGTGDQHGLANSLHNRATILGYLGRYREAMSDFNREIEIFKTIGDQEGLAHAYNSMGALWIDTEQSHLAIGACEKALQLARAMGGPNAKTLDACDCLSKAYSLQGNYRKALEYLQQTMALKDSLQQNETAQRLKQMEIQRQMAFDSLGHAEEKFQMEKALRRKDRTVGTVAAVGLGLLVVALAFWIRMLYFRRRSHRLQQQSDALVKQQLLNEVALLRTQVNPHFLFNSLSILTSLVHTDAKLAERFIAQLSRSYRYILEQKEQSLVSLRTELEFIQAYAFLLKIRFENKFDVQVDLPQKILNNYKIAPLTLQLLLENAVKHNRMSFRAPLIVTITVEDENILVVKNRLRPRNTSATSTGMGLQNIINRYTLLTNRPVWAGETEEQFVVKVPLLH